MKPFIVLPKYLLLAQKYNNQFCRIHQKIIINENEPMIKKQGDIVHEISESEVSNSIQLFDKANRALQYKDLCKDSKRVIEICLIMFQQEVINAESIQKLEHQNKNYYQLIKSYVSKHIINLQLKEQVNAYIKLIVYYRKLDRKNELLQSLKSLLNIILVYFPSQKFQKQQIRQIIKQTYDELLSNIHIKKDVWYQLLRYELRLSHPDYQYLIKILHRHFTQDINIIPLYMIIDKINMANRMIDFFHIKNLNDKRILDSLEKILKCLERGDMKKLKNIYYEEIYNRKVGNLHIIMKILFRKSLKPSIKTEERSKYTNH